MRCLRYIKLAMVHDIPWAMLFFILYLFDWFFSVLIKERKRSISQAILPANMKLYPSTIENSVRINYLKFRFRLTEISTIFQNHTRAHMFPNMSVNLLYTAPGSFTKTLLEVLNFSY